MSKARSDESVGTTEMVTYLEGLVIWKVVSEEVHCV